VWVPEGVAWKAFNKVLKGEIGITIAGGQDDYKDKIFRVSHLGYYDELDMIAFVGALERTLAAVGYKFTPGAGLAATQNAFLTMK
jgi:aspartate aminotransferase-like enzyme